MTWAELKRTVERRGVRDDDVIDGVESVSISRDIDTKRVGFYLVRDCKSHPFVFNISIDTASIKDIVGLAYDDFMMGVKP